MCICWPDIRHLLGLKRSCIGPCWKWHSQWVVLPVITQSSYQRAEDQTATKPAEVIFHSKVAPGTAGDRSLLYKTTYLHACLITYTLPPTPMHIYTVFVLFLTVCHMHTTAHRFSYLIYIREGAARNNDGKVKVIRAGRHKEGDEIEKNKLYFYVSLEFELTWVIVSGYKVSLETRVLWSNYHNSLYNDLQWWYIPTNIISTSFNIHVTHLFNWNGKWTALI